ncbi:phenylacetate--CoA ligase family protein [Alkalihalobacterium elongatum]|uniref:phenylacetate--CoA ligase family protein n=1 Tax=Alkalihalobacterium elongatum TaxID=2675466 RepID=UPI001C1FEE0E|nr:phenylacetate--CoA ligase family protein [Alkalihalobacterium elongatum]
MNVKSETNYKKFWDEERETRSKEERDIIILNRIQEQLEYVYNELPFYRKIYDSHNFKPSDVQSLDDFTEKVPIITKKMLVAEQKENPIFGGYAGNFSEDEIARIHGSSGTSGTPTFYRVSKDDWNRAADVHAMAQWAAGIRPNDIMQIAFPFALFFGGWGVLQGAERIGATAFPTGPMETERQLDLLFKIRPTVFSATPSYCLHLAKKGKELGYDMANCSVKRLLVGGEAGGSLPNTKKALEEGWGASVHDCASTSEMYPFQTNVECVAHQGVHVYTDEVYAEIVHRENPNVRVESGVRGGIVYTHLWRKSQPMIRFWSGDESYIADETCSCGRTYPRLPEGVLGRLDDMLIIRGANIYPSAVENIVRSFQWSGPEFQIIAEKKGELDEMTVKIECLEEKYSEEQIGTWKQEAEAKLKVNLGIRVKVIIVKTGVLDETIFKAKRVVDLR